jgi:dTDP-4-dehydrorhamnose reductase
MKWLVTGAGGMLGRDLLRVLPDGVTALRRADLDITDTAAVGAAVDGHDVVLNAAAWTDVDGAEADEAGATRVNGAAVETLALACAKAGARLVHVSTDYVFPGFDHEPYAEDAPVDPINAYGRSKLAGERAVLDTLPETGYVVRTAWLYGQYGRNFVTTMLRLAAERDTIDVVDDQEGQPTWSLALARHLVELGSSPGAPAGIYHGTASGRTTWFGLARAVFAEAGLDPARVRPTTSETFVRPARRPAFSVLNHDRWRLAGMRPLPEWRPMLSEAFVSIAGTGGAA